MSAPETFDAFYARTAWNVTSQMHSMTGQDSEEAKHQADHAVREAYARAYQQWYEVSGYRDPEAWVLKVAEDAYERRRAQGAGAGSGAPPKADTVRRARRGQPATVRAPKRPPRLWMVRPASLCRPAASLAMPQPTVRWHTAATPWTPVNRARVAQHSPAGPRAAAS